MARKYKGKVAGTTNPPHNFVLQEVNWGAYGHMVDTVKCSDCGKTKHRLTSQVTYVGHHNRGLK